MKKIGITRYAVLSASAFLAGGLMLSNVQATPYASCITNSNGTIQFHLNEGGGTVVVTFDDGSTNASFNGFTSGTNLGVGTYSFTLTPHTTYSIAVTSLGNGTMHMVDDSHTNGVLNAGANGTTNGMFIIGNFRGLEVNKNVTSPYWGRIFFDKSNPGLIYDLDSDGTVVSSGTGGITWPASTYGPYRMCIAQDDYLTVGSADTGTAGVYLITPNLSSGQLLLGPAGDPTPANNTTGPHGLIFSRPYLDGSLSTGSANLYEVDNDYLANQVNCDLIFSNITLATLPWENAPYIGPQIGLNIDNLQNVLSGISRGTNGYFYISEQRGNDAIPNVFVFDSTATNLLWDSLVTTNTFDRFSVAGNGCIDVACSPDGKYLIGLTGCGYIVMCSLTNGIPDASTFVTNQLPSLGSPTGSAQARAISWDSADNFYTISTEDAYLREWTLGQSVKATTIGTASGVTFFNTALLIPTIGLSATPFISQANSYSNPTNGYFTITRTGGNPALPLTVHFTYSGTATNGTYTTGSASGVTFAAGQTTTNIPITAVSDGIPRFTISLTLTVTPSPANYSLQGSGATSMSILNTATPYLTASVGAASMYNAFSNDYATVVITRMGDTNTTLTVNNFPVTGTATQGTDYTAPSPVTFVPGDLTKSSYIYPLIGGQLPVHSATLPYSGNKTVTIGIGGGSGYTAAANTATLTIVDSATPPAPVLYSDPLDNTTSTADTANWTIAAANGNMANYGVDLDMAFGFDLTTAPYSIPFPPNGSQYALMMTVNKSSGQGGTSPSTAVNAYLAGQTFSGNYAVRFSMNVIEPGNLTESGTFNDEEGPLFGINCSGLETNWWVDPINGFGTGAGETNFAADGVFYWMSDSGGRYDDSGYGVYPYREFTGNGSPSTNTGWAEIATQGISPFANVFKTNVFTCFPSTLLPPDNSGWAQAGPGLPANGSGFYSLSDSSWSDVEIRQLNGIVSLLIDKTPIFTYTNTSMFTNGLLMLGYEDPWNGGESSDTAVYYSNLRVVAIGGPIIASAVADNVHHTTVITFSITDDDANTFKVYGSATLTGTYANIPSATVTSLGGGVFQAVVPQSGPTGFYRILQQ